MKLSPKIPLPGANLPKFFLHGAMHEPVSLVHHQVGHPVQKQDFLLIQMEQSAWCGHHHIYPCGSISNDIFFVTNQL